MQKSNKIKNMGSYSWLWYGRLNISENINAPHSTVD